MNATLAHMITGLPVWVWKSSWQAGAMALAVLLAQALPGRRLAAGWRYTLWILVAVRLLLPDVPAAKTSVYNFVPPPQNFAGPGLREALGFQGGGDAPPAAAADDGAATGKPSAVSRNETSHAASLPWRQWLAGIWLAGAAWMLARLVLVTRRFRRAVRRSCRIPSPGVLTLLEEAAAAFKMETPETVETPLADSPAVTGLRHPLVVLPCGLEERFTRDEIRFLLLHELAHIRRGDLWTDLLAGILRAVHWFNPVLWFAFARMRHDREAACDAWVLRTLRPGGRNAYGETLIKVLQSLQPAARPAGIVGILENKSQLRQRLLRIAGYARPTKLAAVGGGLLMLALAATMLTRAETKPAAPQATPAGSPTAAGSPATSSYPGRLTAAARAGDSVLIKKILEESYKGPGLGVSGATQLLNSLVSSRDIEPFKILLKELSESNLGKDWQPNDELLSGLVKDGRTDFLDVLLASEFDLKRLRALQKTADPKMAAWIARRVDEVGRERDGIAKLVEASKKGDVAAVKQLLDAGVDVNGRMSDGSSWTPLTMAASRQRVEVVRLLLERGAKPDLPKYPGWDYTPLCLTSSVEIANMLKAAGANVHATLFGRNTSILTYAAEFNGAPMVQWFLDQGLDPKMIGDNDKTLLFGVKDAATAEILLKAGVDPNRPNEFGQVPLSEARDGGAARALIKGGAKLTGMKHPLVEGMMQFASADAIEAVLQAGAPHDHKTLQGALISAAHMDKDKAAEVLIKYGADPNEAGEWSGPNDTLTPLMTCTIFGSVKTAKVLLAHGANPNGGKMPGQYLMNAMKNHYPELVAVLKQAGAKGVSDLAYALSVGDKKQTATLLASAPAYDKQPEFWQEVMNIAAGQGDLETVKAAVAKGAPTLDKGAQMDGVKTDAYYAAASNGNWEVLDFLLQQRKPDSNPGDLDQAMWGAVWNCHPYENQRPAADFEKCLKLLLSTGASARMATRDQGLVTTAVFTRNPGGNARVIEMLVAAGADPNPKVEKEKRLSDAISESCKTPSCSTPNEEILTTLEKLGNVKIDRGK